LNTASLRSKPSRPAKSCSGTRAGAQVCDWKGKGALPLGGFGSPGIQHDDFSVDLRAAEWQQVDNGNLLKGISSDVSLICRCLFFGLYCMPYDCV
jgi:hypothetical protein